MRIAFDLDGTLIPAPGSAMRTEPLGLFARLISSEQLREHTPALRSRGTRSGFTPPRCVARTIYGSGLRPLESVSTASLIRHGMLA
jgi:hypothetical protein